MSIQCHYADEWGAIFEYSNLGLMEIRWYDATADLSGDDFNRFL